MRSCLYYVVLMFVVMVTACHDERDSGGNIIGPSENGKLTVSFTMNLPANSSGISTYGKTVNDENAISQVDVLAFKHSGGDEYFAYHVQATDIKDAKTDGSEKTMQVKVEESSDTYTYVVLANVRSEITSLGIIPTSRKKDEVLADLIHTHTGEIWDTTKEFPMWGETSPIVITAGTNTLVKVSMLRMVARIDITASVATSKFEMTDIYVYNVHSHGHIAPDNSCFDSGQGKVTATTIPTISSKSVTPAHYSTPTQQFIREIYVYESTATDVHTEKTCLVIGGKYEGATDPTYYRVDMLDSNGKDLHLLRNHWYTINIKDVKGEGLGGPDPAFEAVPADIEVDVMEWNQGGIRDIIFNEKYFLGVSESELYIPAAATDTFVVVTTNYPNCWEATFDSSSSSWLTRGTGSCTGLEKKDTLKFHLDENPGEAIRLAYINLKAGPLTHRITVYQDIDKGEDADVIYKEEGDANCYILSPDSNGIIIPVTQANKDNVTRIRPGDIVEAEVLWTDQPYAVGDPSGVIKLIKVEGTGQDAKIKVAANGIKGNAVVAAKVGGKIRWSWHIWVLDYQPEATAVEVTAGIYTLNFMDHNLGALSSTPGDPESMGFLYQWGRKDPFPGQDAFTTSNVQATERYDSDGILITESTPYNFSSGTDMLEVSIERPMQYIKGGTSYKDWLYDQYGKGDDLWTLTNNQPSPYDPCPAGWTIAIPIKFWQNHSSSLGFTYSNGNYGFNSQVGFWPAGGYLTENGTFVTTDIGSTGYYWAGDPNGSYGTAILLKSTVDHGQSRFRSYGLSVRCIQIK